MTIRVLDRQTIDQIAAGEVIERPASVVKELVENALDAGATQVGVAVKGGGVSLIRVTDNGHGIKGEEISLAFERHATSKITGAGDLFAIGSLGFRGEALPSIAAVADAEVLSQAQGEASGTYIALENGAVTRRQAQARARGTTVTVRNLFKRVPARLKFLKTASTENGHIANAVTRYALAFPEVSFSLIIEGRATLRTSGRGNLIDAISDVYGAKMAARMLPVEASETGWSVARGDSSVGVTGMVGAPELGRSGRGYLSFFVNRRWVTSRTLAYAVEEAYQGLLMVGRHPVAVLDITVPPDAVDVNIHPAKSEVKFRHEPDVFRAVQRAVRGALTEQMAVPGVAEPPAPFAAPPAAGSHQGVFPERESYPATETAPSFLMSLPALRVVGQVMDSYIVAEGPDGLYVIDQHAAHERVRYDAITAQRAAKQPAAQGLLEPGTLEVTPRQDAVLQTIITTLGELGFALEPFGERSYLVRAVPAHLLKGWDEALRGLLDELGGELQKSRWEEKTVASIACHNAIRSGQTLSLEEMRELVRQMEQTANPHTCPHGRPTIIKVGRDYIERHFGRG